MVMATHRRLVSPLLVAVVLALALALALIGALWHPAPAAGQSLTPSGAALACVATMNGC